MSGMNYAEKMYMIPQHQLDKLRTSNQRESLQQVVENDLDMTIRNILYNKDLEPYEKAKMYTSVLQRYLTVSRLGDKETNTLTLSFPTADGGDEVQLPPTTTDSHDVTDVVVDEVLKNVPQRSLKNIRYILDKMSKTKNIASWTDSGEFVFKGRTIEGSHILDLVKSITAPQKIVDERRPTGWHEFLEAFATLNIPYSTIANHYVRHAINSFKTRTS